MFINVTAKAQKLFQNYPMAKNQDKAQIQALANPLYSWHCTSFTLYQYQMACFINDKSGLVVLVPDVTTKDSSLQEKFEKYLTEQLESAGQSHKQIRQYIKNGGPWTINHTIDRSVLSELSQAVRDLKQQLGEAPGQPNEFDEDDQEQSSSSSLEEIKNSQVSAINGKDNDLSLHNIIRQLIYFTSHRDQPLHDTNFDRQLSKLQQLNEALISAFIQSEKDQLSQRTLNRHQDRLTLFLNEYLAYQMETIFSDNAYDLEAPLSKGFSLNEMKQTRTAMKKLNQFLFDQGQITRKQLEFVKDVMNSQLKTDNEASIFSQLGIINPTNVTTPSMPSNKVASLVKTYCKAAVNLYGLITCDQLFRIIVKQNPTIQIEPSQLLFWFDQQRQNQSFDDDFLIFDESSGPVIVQPEIYRQGLQWDLLNEQFGKPFYLPGKEQFLKYQEPSYFEETTETKKYRKFISQQMGVPKSKEDYLISQIRKVFNERFDQKMGKNIQYLNDHMFKQGYTCKDESVAQKWIDLFMRLYQHMRLFVNRGMTPTEELSEIPIDAELENKHKLTSVIIKRLLSAKLDPEEVVMTVSSLNRLSERQQQKIVDQIFGLGLPSLDIG